MKVKEYNVQEERLKGYARGKIVRAIKNGNIKRPSKCYECGNAGTIQAHHPDYNKPIEVVWLCIKCHRSKHKAKFARVTARFKYKKYQACIKKALIYVLTCRKCGHEWIPRIQEIRICPRCKTKYFEKGGYKKYRESQRIKGGSHGNRR